MSGMNCAQKPHNSGISSVKNPLDVHINTNMPPSVMGGF